MQLEQNFKLDQAPAQVWQAFKNVELLVTCLPGATLTGPAVDGELPLRFEVRLGPIAAAFVGGGRVTLDDTTQSGKFEGQATDKRTGSRVKGVAVFTLTPQRLTTAVNVNIDYALTGALAQFSRGAIVRELATALTAQFAANLAKKISASSIPVSEKTAEVSNLKSAATAPIFNAPLDGWALIKQIFAVRFKRWLGVLGFFKAS